MDVLKLVLKKEWFDMFDAGIKKEEYRSPTNYILPRVLKLVKPFEVPHAGIKYDNVARAYWFCRGYKKTRQEALDFLLSNGAEWRKYDAVQFQHGYKTDAKRIIFELTDIKFGNGTASWGANPSETYFVLSVGKKLFIKTDLTD